MFYVMPKGMTHKAHKHFALKHSDDQSLVGPCHGCRL